MGKNTILHTFLLRFRQFGGWKVLAAYTKMGALWPIARIIMRHPFNRKTYRRAYVEGLQIVEPFLKAKYKYIMQQRKGYYSELDLEHGRNNTIWFCWLQGLNNAPRVVKACYTSLQKHLTDREIKVIDGENWRDYVSLPDYIIKKWEKSIIPPAMFSDLLRLQLLITYGGTWIDASVLCTGITPQNRKETLSYLDSDLFVFQYARPGVKEWNGISNWFITACLNNEVLMVLRDMLLEYWREYDYTLDYYIFHLFFDMLRGEYPKEIAEMPYGYSMWSLALMFNMDKPFNQEKWDKHTTQVCFHKLAYSVRDDVIKKSGNYYHYIVDDYLVKSN